MPQKPEWQILIDHLVYHDSLMLYRICRKMIIHLDRMKAPEIFDLMKDLNPAADAKEQSQYRGPNWPKPKGSPFNPHNIFGRIFEVADKYLSDDEITQLISQWIYQEQTSFVSSALEQRRAPLSTIVDALKKYAKLTDETKLQQPLQERIGVRVSLIQRLLSGNLRYINIAKDYIKIVDLADIIDRIVGPAGGTGKLGGKSSGLILATHILESKKKENPILEKIYTPKSWFMTSDGIHEFIHYNALEEFVYSKYQSPEEIEQDYPFLEYIFKNSHFPHESIHAFGAILDDIEGKPIVVRSSSLLEDSFEASFAGKYKSLFIANIGSKEERLCALMNAVAEVYASAFSPDPIEYRKERDLIHFREEMGVLIQEVVGNKIGKYFMPSYAGVAFSNNEFLWSQRLKRDDGVVRLVAGLGTRAVDRTINDYPTLISPGQPGLKVNTSIEDMVRYSQRYIDVINLETNNFETVEFSKLIKDCCDYLPGLEKIVSFDRRSALVDPVSSFIDFKKEELVVTFKSLIERTNFVKQLREMLKELKAAFKCPVDIEFASDGEKLYLLQCRPQSHFEKDAKVSIPVNIDERIKIFTASRFVNNGVVKGLRYAVYVDSEGYSNLRSEADMKKVGKIVGSLNRGLPRRKFVLMGPGRWGSKGDIKLGVPAIYSDINNAAILIEIARERSGYAPELSFGTHFFQDLVEANIKYLPLYPDEESVLFNDSFFNESKNHLMEFVECHSSFLKVVKVIDANDYDNKTISIYMDGETSHAVAFLE